MLHFWQIYRWCSISVVLAERVVFRTYAIPLLYCENQVRCSWNETLLTQLDSSKCLGTVIERHKMDFGLGNNFCLPQE